MSEYQSQVSPSTVPIGARSTSETENGDSNEGNHSKEGERSVRNPAVLMTSKKRITKELDYIRMDPPPNCTAEAKNENMYEWIASILGPPGSPYEGGKFFLNINFPSDYPFNPPEITFTTKIYHCNINSQGHICLDILKENWSPALSIWKVLFSICLLLNECNPSDPLMSTIAIQYQENREEHDRVARLWTKRYAC